MRKELFIQLLEINSKNDKMLENLYNFMSEQEKDLITVNNMFSTIMTEEYGEEASDLILERLYEKPNNVDNKIDLDSLYEEVEKLKK